VPQTGLDATWKQAKVVDEVACSVCAAMVRDAVRSDRSSP
jgi:hypothetical protein